jgi:hypothetical protein
MSRCLGTKRDNSPCTVTVEPPHTYCWWHDPANAEARKQAAARGGRRAGRGRPVSELVRLQGRFEDLADKVLSGEMERAKAAVACQLLNGARACVRDALSAREQEELEARIAALERAGEARSPSGGRGGRWGA